MYVHAYTCCVYNLYTKNVFSCHCSPAASEIVTYVILAALKFHVTTW